AALESYTDPRRASYRNAFRLHLRGVPSVSESCSPLTFDELPHGLCVAGTYDIPIEFEARRLRLGEKASGPIAAGACRRPPDRTVLPPGSVPLRQPQRHQCP